LADPVAPDADELPDPLATDTVAAAAAPPTGGVDPGTPAGRPSFPCPGGTIGLISAARAGSGAFGGGGGAGGVTGGPPPVRGGDAKPEPGLFA
jgi:hypothetical protein